MSTIEAKLDLLLANQVTKAHFNEVVSKLDKRVAKNEEDISILKTKVDDMPINIYEEIHEQDIKKKNVIIFKLQEVDENDKKKKFVEERNVVQGLLNDMTDFELLSEGDLNFRFFRIGKDNASKPRPMIVSFESNIIRDKVLESCKNLKGKEKWKGISIVPDLTKIQQNLSKQSRKKLSDEANKKNAARTDAEKKTIEWKVIGHYGLGNLRLGKITKDTE